MRWLPGSLATQVRQPAGPAQAEAENPLAKSLVYARKGGDWDRSLRVGAKRVPHQAGLLDGFGSTVGTGGTDSLELPFSANSIQRTYLVFCEIRGAGGGANGRLFDKRTTTPQNELMFTNGSQMRYGRSFTGGTGEWFCTAPTNRVFAFALTYDSSSVSNVPKMYVDGVSQSVSTFATPTTGPALVTSEPYVLGNIKTVNSRNWDGLIGGFFVWDRLLSDEEIAQASRNPWQLLARPHRMLWAPAEAGGPAPIELAANAQASGTATASLSTSIRLAASAQASGTASADLQVGSPILLAAAATASGTATAALSTSIRLAAAAQASGTATANLQAGSAQALSAAAVAQATASAQLTTAILLQASAVASGTASAQLTVSSGLAASAIAQAQATAALTTAILMSAVATASATATAALTVGEEVTPDIPLSRQRIVAAQDRTRRVPYQNRSRNVPA